MNYSEKFKDPRWQKLRLKVFERDEWKCQSCGSEKETLVVHHFYYKQGADPWEYDMDALITLCEGCHEFEHENWKDNIKVLIEILKEGKFLADDLVYLGGGLQGAKYNGTPSNFASAFNYFFSSTNIPKNMVNEYLKLVEKGKRDGEIKITTD